MKKMIIFEIGEDGKFKLIKKTKIINFTINQFVYFLCLKKFFNIHFERIRFGVTESKIKNIYFIEKIDKITLKLIEFKSKGLLLISQHKNQIQLNRSEYKEIVRYSKRISLFELSLNKKPR